jgi:hypothetical protein
MTRSREEKSAPRTLIYFPIIHTQADMGALGESVRQASLKKLGGSSWKRKVSRIDQFWTEIEQAIEKLRLPFDQVRIYQDGLPVSGRETEIVSELAKSGSRNHALLLRLIGKGATIMGTESLELLLEEYELARRTLGSQDPPQRRSRDKGLSAPLLERRDKFIAGRINDTLRPGEVGVLFLGMLHSLDPWLDEDIKVIYPAHRPVQRGNRAGRG